MKDQFKLPGDARTFRQASEELGIDYNKLRQYIYYHRVPFG